MERFSGIYWAITFFTGFLTYLSPYILDRQFKTTLDEHELAGIILMGISSIGIIYKTYKWFKEEKKKNNDKTHNDNFSSK